VRLLVRHACSRENALLLQRGAVVGRFRYCIREEQSPAAVAAAVAKESSGRAAGDDSFGGGVDIATLAIRP
jgi:hypothetical protein